MVLMLTFFMYISNILITNLNFRILLCVIGEILTEVLSSPSSITYNYNLLHIILDNHVPKARYGIGFGTLSSYNKAKWLIISLAVNTCIFFVESRLDIACIDVVVSIHNHIFSLLGNVLAILEIPIL